MPYEGRKAPGRQGVGEAAVAGGHREPALVPSRIGHHQHPRSVVGIDDILHKRTTQLTWLDSGVTLGVVVASNGYPLDYEKGVVLPAKTEGDITTYYAGARFAENSRALLSNGGRVYMLVTTADTVQEAQEKIYSELKKQDTTGLFYRTDIGSKAVK